MGRAKKTTDTETVSDNDLKSAQLHLKKAELKHWQDYCDNQGYAKDEKHQYTPVLETLQAHIDELNKK